MDKTTEKDWRLDPNDDFLKGETFCFKTFKSSAMSDHEHCYFCWQKITDLPIENSDREGYCTISSETGQKIWVCKNCFDDFKKRFDFKLK